VEEKERQRERERETGNTYPSGLSDISMKLKPIAIGGQRGGDCEVYSWLDEQGEARDQQMAAVFQYKWLLNAAKLP
jgi:hypothetical protein